MPSGADSSDALTARERRETSGGSSPPSLLDPGRDCCLISPGRPAQACRLPHERLIELALASALQDARHMRQEVGAARSELPQLPHRSVMLGPGQLAPAGVTFRGAVDPRDEDAVSL